jgi:hypothetical protein
MESSIVSTVLLDVLYWLGGPTGDARPQQQQQQQAAAASSSSKQQQQKQQQQQQQQQQQLRACGSPRSTGDFWVKKVITENRLVSK